MKIRVEDIPEHGLEVQLTGTENLLTEALQRIGGQRGLEINPNVRGKFQLMVNAGEILFTGAVEAIVLLQCSRCLADFNQQMSVDLNLVIRRMDTEEFLADREPDEGEAEAVFIESGEIDPGEIIAQELLLAVPMKPLCREDCPGLCPKCGALKGSAECKCGTEQTVDPRWEALAKLKQDLGP